MFRIFKLAITISLAGIFVSTTCPAGSLTDAIVNRMFGMYGLDRSTHTIEILSNPLKTAEVSTDDVVIRPLTPKKPLGLFTVMVTINEDGRPIEEGQVRMRIKRFGNVMVTTDRIHTREKLIC